MFKNLKNWWQFGVSPRNTIALMTMEEWNARYNDAEDTRDYYAEWENKVLGLLEDHLACAKAVGGRYRDKYAIEEVEAAQSVLNSYKARRDACSECGWNGGGIRDEGCMIGPCPRHSA